MSTDGALDGYFDALEGFRAATRARDYPLAAQYLRLGLQELHDRALHGFVAGWGVPPSIPFVQGPGLAIASLYPAEATDRLFSELAEHPALEARFSNQEAVEAARIVRDLRAAIEGAPGLDRKQLRDRLAPVDGRVMGSLLDYLVKGKLVFDRAGTYSAQAPHALPSEVTSTGFRQGAPLVHPQLLNLLEAPSAVGAERKGEQRDEHTPALMANPADDHAPDEVVDVADRSRRWPVEPIAPVGRRAGRATTLVLAHHSWLLRYTHPTTATEHQYTAEIRDAQNRTVARLDLPHPPKRITAFPERHHLVILDTAGHLRAYREDGEILAQHNVGASPELQQALTDSLENALVDQGRPGTVVSAVDWEAATGRLLLAAAGKVWCLDGDGRMVWSHQLPPAPSWPARWTRTDVPSEVRVAARALGLRPDLTPREATAALALAGVTGEEPPPSRHRALSALWQAVGSWNTEWVGAAYFTSSGATVCGSSGLNIDLDQLGRPVRVWLSGYGFTPLAFTAGGIAGTVRGWLVTVADQARDATGAQANPVAEHSVYAPGAVALDATLAVAQGRRLAVASLDGQPRTSFQLPRPLTALVPTSSGLIVEMGNRRALLPT